LIGLIAFCVLLVHVARCLARGLAADHARAGAAIAGLAILAGFLVKNMSDDFFNRDVAMVVWALLNMCLAMVCRDAGRPA
jgi:peptidoglycan/LPS O-acetylase OafA/YrhL